MFYLDCDQTDLHMSKQLKRQSPSYVCMSGYKPNHDIDSYDILISYATVGQTSDLMMSLT